ncbi:MAG: DUF5681 domain-containing protein [Roseiarcus sp.]|jgi:hypothetical protein
MTAHAPPKIEPSKSYDVGYCKPPKSGQFKPGQSGNPHGKPKKQPLMAQPQAKNVTLPAKIGGEVTPTLKEQCDDSA